ncbi:MAG: 3-methyl-2-oxobutanoate dehydrogenase subunit VorB [Clostridiales Family XIII bacterium]|jgi:2-oxoglutarate ferredoxin oxidoreductase subunit alpha|nr:3-methyl-2-oxobutanoate dehydrogenase subunit VorB [Clostridiales Family XIII bacterium]
MARIFMKGNEAIAEAAVRAGCRFYAGYPITPQNEIPEYMARRLPEVGGNFVQGESEVASINLVYGSAQTGTRSMTSSSSCGISLMSEGISFIASARIPAVYVNVARGGPGIGAIQPAQQDYLQATKASGNGGFRMIVLAPYDVQEAVDMTYAAFDIADRDRNPVLILADGVLGTIMEPIMLPEEKSPEEVKALKDAKRNWALVGHRPDEKRAMIEPGRFAGQEPANIENAKLYETWDKDIQVEEYLIDDAEVVIAAYGISARIAKSAISLLRKDGYKVGLIRPKTVSPFPYASFANLDFGKVKAILDVEMSIPAQMIWDVQYAVRGRCPIETTLRSGGEIMGRDQILKAAKELCER